MYKYVICGNNNIKGSMELYRRKLSHIIEMNFILKLYFYK